MDREPDLVAGAHIEIGMRSKEGVRFVGWRIAEATDIMMAVALGVRYANQRPQRKVLLHGKAGLTGQVFARDKEFFAARAPLRGAGRVDDGLVDTLARF